MAEQRTLKDLQGLINGWDKNEVLASYLNPGDVDISEEPYEDALRGLMSDPNAIQELLKTGNKAFVKKYAKSLLKGKNIFDLYEMNLDNITESIKEVSGDDEFKKEDILNQDKPYLNVDGSTLKAIATVNGWDFPSMLKLIEEEQTKQGRKKVYDESLIARTVFPRISESMRDKGDFDRADVALDIVENVAQAVPLGGFGAKAAGVGLRSGLTAAEKAGRVGRQAGGWMLENASVPTVMAGADQLIRNKDGFDWGEFGQRAVTGSLVNASAGKMVKAGLSAIVPDPKFGKWIDDVFDSGDEALKSRLTEIEHVLSQGRSANPEAYKNAMNELFILKNKSLFSNGQGNLADYVAGNTRKVGKNTRRIYEKEVERNLDKPWAQKVRTTEIGLDPKSPYFLNREITFPHQYVNTNKLGTKSGVLKEVGGATGKDLPEFNIYNQKNLGIDDNISSQLAKIASEHNSLTFKYPTEFDNIVNALLNNEQTRKAIMRVYGGTNPREAVETFVLNKLGRADWLKRGESAAYRTFGEYSGLKPKKDKKEK